MWITILIAIQKHIFWVLGRMTRPFSPLKLNVWSILANKMKRRWPALFYQRKFKTLDMGTSLLVQWLRCCTSIAGGLGSTPGQGSRSCMPFLVPPENGKKNTRGTFCTVLILPWWQRTPTWEGAYDSLHTWLTDFSHVTQTELPPCPPPPFSNLVMLHGMLNLSSPTRDWTRVPCSGSSGTLTTETPGNSHSLHPLAFFFLKHWHEIACRCNLTFPYCD